jgi:hypothetical protein
VPTPVQGFCPISITCIYKCQLSVWTFQLEMIYLQSGEYFETSFRQYMGSLIWSLQFSHQMTYSCDSIRNNLDFQTERFQISCLTIKSEVSAFCFSFFLKCRALGNFCRFLLLSSYYLVQCLHILYYSYLLLS